MRRAIGMIVLVVGLAGTGFTAWGQCNQDCPEKRTISVQGNGTVTADADHAVVHVGYKLYGPEARTAYASATEVSNAIMQALTASGIERSGIESTSQVVQHTSDYELQRYQAGSEEFKGRQFTVSQSWVIRVKPDDAGKALDTAITAGANESGWIQWVVDDPSVLQAKASAEALTNARKIAEQMAQKSGIHVGHLVSVTGNQNTYAFNGQAGAAASLAMGSPVVSSLVMGNQQLAINSRRVEFDISVYAVFAIE